MKRNRIGKMPGVIPKVGRLKVGTSSLLVTWYFDPVSP